MVGLFKVFSIFILIISLCGCSATRTIKNPPLSDISNNNNGCSVLAIDPADLLKSKVLAVGSSHNLTVYNGDDLLDLIKYEAVKYFKEVIVLKGNDTVKYDVLLRAKPDTKSIMGIGGGNGFLFTSKMSYSATAVNENNKVYFGDVLDDYVVYRPDGIMPLAVLTGLSLGLLSPITLPAMTNIAADAITKEVSESDKRISKGLVEKLVMSNLHVKKQ